MSRYIDAALIEKMLESLESEDVEMYGGVHIAECFDSERAIEHLRKLPTADVEEVRHGKWVITEYEYYDCSVCGESYFNGCDSTKEARERLKLRPYDVYDYCPYCGAKMDGGKE